MAYTDDGIGLGRRVARVQTRTRIVHVKSGGGAAKPFKHPGKPGGPPHPAKVYAATRRNLVLRRMGRRGLGEYANMEAYSDDGLGKFRLKKIFKPPKAFKKLATKIVRANPLVAVARAAKRTVKGKAFKAAFSKRNLMKNLKIAGIVAAVAGVAVGGAVFGPAIIAKLGGKGLSLLAKAKAAKAKAGEVLGSDASPEQITAAAAQYDALPADQKPPLEPVQAVDASGAVVGVVPPTAYATVGAEYPAPATGGMEPEGATVVTQEGGTKAAGGFPLVPVAIGVVVLGGVLYMVFRKKR